MVKREIMHYYDVSETKISVVHNGVEWKQLAFPFENRLNIKKDLIEKYQIPPTPYTYLFIGNDYRRKGLDRLLKALSGIKEEWHLIVIGKDRNMDSYQRLAKNLSIESNTTFLGYVPNVAPFYALADCVVIPSLYDPFANVTVEALAMGCFVITSLSNGGSEIITPLNGTVIENMTDEECFRFHLRKGLQYDKSEHAIAIRNSISYLDFDFQLNQLATVCLKNF
jgi:UDP-glucose:(heptosyl)LPS alpha-1,3-glucosyltransferase